MSEIVPTTKTLVDAQQEHKQLQEKITGLKIAKENAERDHASTLAATQTLRDEQAKIAAAMQADREHTFRILKEAEKVIDDAFILLRLADGIAAESLSFVKLLDEKAAQIMKDIENSKAVKDAHHENIVREEKALDTKREDLQVYEGRLKEKIIEMGLENKIKIL